MLEDCAPHGPQRPINSMIRPNVKAHPSKGKMAQKYLCALELANDTTVEDTVELRACGACRNCYFFQKLCLALKMLVDDTSRWSTHAEEAEGLAKWAPKLPQHLPIFWKVRSVSSLPRWRSSSGGVSMFSRLADLLHHLLHDVPPQIYYQLSWRQN